MFPTSVMDAAIIITLDNIRGWNHCWYYIKQIVMVFTVTNVWGILQGLKVALNKSYTARFKLDFL